MAKEVTTKGIILTSIITAFTIATGLIWKDVIIDAIETIVPASEELFFKFIIAIIATITLVTVLYLILKTESEAEKVVMKIKKTGKKKRKNR